MDSKLDLIISHLKELDNKIDKVESNLLSTIKKNINDINTEISMLKTENQDLKLKIENQQSKMDTMERQLKYNNIILFGANIKEGSLQNFEDQIINILNTKVDLSNKDINYVRKLGKQDGPILIALNSWNKKRELLKNKREIQKDLNITIKEDLPQEVRNIRKELAVYWKKNIDDGKKVLLRHDKLIINGKPWTLEDLKNEESNNNKRQRSETPKSLEKEVRNLSKRKNSTSSSTSNRQDTSIYQFFNTSSNKTNTST